MIGIDLPTEGLMSIVGSVMTHVEYALDRGYVPVVDMKDFQSIYQKNDVNAWELFFEQPCGYSLSDVYGARNVVFSMNVRNPKGFNVNSDGLEYTEKRRKIYAKYLRPSVSLQSRLENVSEAVKVCRKQTLACICRGTDYNNTLVGISKQPTVEMVIEKSEGLYVQV